MPEKEWPPELPPEESTVSTGILDPDISALEDKVNKLELKYPTSLDKYVRQNLKDISLRLTKNSKFVNSAMEKPKFIE